MKKTLMIIAVLAIIIPESVTTAQTDFTLRHSFSVQSDDGKEPQGSLILGGSNLYGMTRLGGASNYGTIFSIQTGGSDFTIIHSFSGAADGGKWPYGSVIFDDNTLFGMTFSGGSIGLGTIFSIQNDGTDFTLLHDFGGNPTDGQYSYGSLIRDGNVLYGMTWGGGFYDNGTIFSIQNDGTDFTLLHSFSTQSDDGKYPYGDLVLTGNTLYGMTRRGGSYDDGTIFSIQNIGTDFTLLHSFSSGFDDGKFPYGSLVLEESVFYGMTYFGGPSDYGTIFSIQNDGTDFTLLHSFAGGSNDGEEPRENLILYGSTLYGMTHGGGFYDEGTIFSIQNDGTDFTLLHSFSAQSDDGGFPYGSLFLTGNTLYGMTMFGGEYDVGTSFSFRLPSPTPSPSAIPTPEVTPTSPVIPSPTASPMSSTSPTPPPPKTPTPIPTYTPTATSSPYPTPMNLVLQSSDFNGDGTSDITVFRQQVGLWAIRGLTRFYYGQQDDYPVAGDYDGDGTTEIAIFRSSTGLWAVKGSTRFYFGSSNDLPVPADYYDDGRCNAAVFRKINGLWSIRDLTRVYFGTSGDIPVPGDYDGKGVARFGIFRPSTGLWAFHGISRVYFGSSGDKPVPGNYSGNGSSVIGIFRSASGLWAIRGVTRAYFGRYGDRPVPADFDGDSFSEIGVFRSSSGLWAIRELSRLYFGTIGDSPVTR